MVLVGSWDDFVPMIVGFVGLLVDLLVVCIGDDDLGTVAVMLVPFLVVCVEGVV